MKVRCIARCQFRGDILRVGQELDAEEGVLKDDPVARASLAPVTDADAKRRPPSGPIVAGLTRKQALAKLASVNVGVPSDATDEEIAKRFNEAFDAKRAHSAKE